MLFRHHRHLSYQYRTQRNDNTLLLDSRIDVRKLLLHATLFMVIVVALTVVCVQIKNRYLSTTDMWQFRCDLSISETYKSRLASLESKQIAYADTPNIPARVHSTSSSSQAFAFLFGDDDISNQVVCIVM